MKKLLIIALLFVSTITHAQFSIDMGASVIASNTLRQNFTYEDINFGTRYEYSEMKTLGLGILVYPRFFITEVGSMAIGIGSPSNLAIDANFKSLGLIDANLTLDLVGGGLNILNEADNFGYYVGIGYGITFLIENTPNKYGSSFEKSALYNDIEIVEYSGSEKEYNSFHNGMTKSLFVHAGIGGLPILGSNIGLRIGYKPCFGNNCLSYLTTSAFVTIFD